VYERLGLRELKPTRMILQLASRFTRTPRGVDKDVLFKVGEFIFPMDFTILKPKFDANLEAHIDVILGRPFLATSNTLINCRNGVIKLSFGNMTLNLNIFNLQRQHVIFDETDSVNWLDVYAWNDSCGNGLVKNDIYDAIGSLSPDSFNFTSFVTHAS